MTEHEPPFKHGVIVHGVVVAGAVVVDVVVTGVVLVGSVVEDDVVVAGAVVAVATAVVGATVAVIVSSASLTTFMSHESVTRDPLPNVNTCQRNSLMRLLAVSTS